MEPDAQLTKPPAAKRHWPLHLHRRGTWLVIGIVMLVLALTSYFGLHDQSKPATAQKYLAHVSVTSSGFNPSVLGVKSGTQVTWINADTKPHQVAADPYPKNNSIPNFDSTQTLLTNDSYSFTFNQRGTYHYHDQLNPLKLLGTVVVK